MRDRVSILVPSYNRRALLEKTLDYIALQRLDDGVEMEVIVVDDGSDDGTDNLLANQGQRFSRFESVWRPRDDPRAFTVSQARNMGLERVTGNALAMIDTGVIVPPDFVSRIARSYRERGSRVLIPRCVGVLLDPADPYRPVPASIPAEFLEQIARQLAHEPQWKDWREMFFCEHGGDLSMFPAPWILAWGGALVAPSADIQALGFDETFSRWGGEDEDMALRLYRRGLRFEAMESYTIHLPHPPAKTKISVREVKSASSYRRKIHQRDQSLETELLSCVTTWSLNQALQQLDSLMLDALVPPYPPALGQELWERHVGPHAPTLVSGIDSLGRASIFPCTHIHTHSGRALRRIEEACPDKSIAHRIGCDTLLPSGYFHTTVLTDLWRMMGRDMLIGVLAELSRISQRLLLIESPRSGALRPGSPMLVPGAWNDQSALAPAAAAAGLSVHPLDSIEGHAILSLQTKEAS